ncbi:MAG: helicase-related protein, partial [Pseudomonadota bacterium]
LQAPERIEVARQATASETIEQGVVMFKPSRRDRADSEKRKLLRAMIDAEGETCTNAIIFCNRKTDVDICAKSLKKYGYNAAAIHGDLDQSQRTKTLEAFRGGELTLLVASDVTARGLDIPSVSHVFNFDVPSHAEDYVHRIGRTGRAGREGKAVTLCNPRDEKALAAVENLIQKEIARQDNPVKSKPKTEDEAAERKPRRGRGKAKDDAVEDTAVEAKEKTEKPSQYHERGERDKSRRKVVGMGDHMPSFIAMSFDERMAG